MKTLTIMTLSAALTACGTEPTLPNNTVPSPVVVEVPQTSTPPTQQPEEPKPTSLSPPQGNTTPSPSPTPQKEFNNYALFLDGASYTTTLIVCSIDNGTEIVTYKKVGPGVYRFYSSKLGYPVGSVYYYSNSYVCTGA